MAALRRIKSRQELRGIDGANFRPGIFPLFDDEWHENLLHCLEQTETNAFQPLFVATPTLHLGAPRFKYYKKPKNRDWSTTHFSKSLVEYHYRFKGGLEDASVSETFNEHTPATVRELWCVVVDNRNIITASYLHPNFLWPNAKEMNLRYRNSPSSFVFAFWENPPDRVDVMFKAPVYSHATTLLGALGVIVSHLLPIGGQIMFKLNDFITKKLSGVEYSMLMRMNSLTMLLQKAKGEPNTKGKSLMNSAFILMNIINSGKINAPETNLSRLQAILQDCTKFETDMRFHMHEEGPSEETFNILKKVWAIAIVFSLNFYFTPAGHIHSLQPKTLYERLGSVFRRRKAKVKQQGADQDIAALDMPIRFHPRKPGETLRDLERDLTEILAILAKHTQAGTETTETKDNADRENLLLLEEINKSGHYASLFCLLRVCIFSTPARFSTFNRLVVDFYARRITTLEWLIRDQATQSLVYELSRLADELRIAMDIILSQRSVVTNIAEKFLTAISAERALATKGVVPKDTSGNNGETAKPAAQNQKPNRATNTFQAKVRMKHDSLLADLEKLQDTTERLKRQAALLLEIKVEGQNTAIFVFTVVTVIFLPLSFVTSFFGMNTADIRDLEEGQWIFWTVGISLTVVVLLLAWVIPIKGRGWLTARRAHRLYSAEC
ncbi:cora-like Mg2+ transporter protein-domain-containing protein [Nemania sp. FL0916]|nr:cora-like Mg2+ transporter protein-domain-containing protein [Nemania sp. FL0916]